MIMDKTNDSHDIKSTLIYEIKEHLIPILLDQFSEVLPKRPFDDKDLNLCYGRNIMCRNPKYGTNDKDLSELLVIHSLEKYASFNKFLRQINAAYSKGLPILHILHKSSIIGQEIYGDFHRPDRELSSIEKFLFEQHGEIPYFNRHKKTIDLVTFTDGNFETIDTLESFRLDLEEYPSKYPKVGLEKLTTERRFVNLKNA